MYPTASSALHAIQALETRLLKQADLVVASSDQDRVYFEDIARGQGFEMRACLVANNAVESHSALFTQWAARKQYVQQQSLHIALFAGSWHGPNLQAVDAIIQAAEQLTNDPQLGGGADWRFVVLGSVGDAYAVKPSGVAALTTVQGMKSGLKFGFHGLVKHWPSVAKRLAGLGARARPLRRGPSGSSCEKIHFTGVVSEAEKAAWLARATVGLNPILTGSGTNLKMAEYAAWGLPVLSTAFGARGGIWKEDSHYGLIDAKGTQDLPLAINNALNYFLQQARQEGVIENRVSCAQATVRQTLDWSVSAKAMRNGINAMVNNNHPG
jgi:glycosyltransferase involved in cell wall biosynthesis